MIASRWPSGSPATTSSTSRASALACARRPAVASSCSMSSTGHADHRLGDEVLRLLRGAGDRARGPVEAIEVIAEAVGLEPAETRLVRGAERAHGVLRAVGSTAGADGEPDRHLVRQCLTCNLGAQ